MNNGLKFIIRYLFAFLLCLIFLIILNLLKVDYDAYSMILGMILTIILVLVDRIIQNKITKKL